MKTPSTLNLRNAALLAIACLGLAAQGAVASTRGAEAAATSRYQQERAACLNGQSNQDRTTCLREAAAALEAARRGDLTDESPTQYERNALERCVPLHGEDRLACEARMHGYGTTTGSVASGGILRELVILEAGRPAAEADGAPRP